MVGFVLVVWGGLLLLVGAAPSHAQDEGAGAVVQGFVRGAANGQSLQGATVIVRDTAGTRQGGDAANGRGFYQIAGLSSGRYVLSIRFVGYEPYRDTLRLESGARRTVSVSLEDEPQELEEVTVRGEDPVGDAEAGLREIGAAEIETIPTPGPGGDLAAYLRSLPGVSTIGDRGGRLFVRGGSPSQNLMLVDGMPVYKPFHIVGFYSAFPSELVANTNFYAGGFGAEYMGRISSVLDVHLRSGNTKTYAGSVGMGPFTATGHVEGPIQRGDVSFLLHARHSLVEEAGPTLLGEEMPYKFYDVTAKVHTQDESSQCSFVGLRTYDRGRIDRSRGASIRWDNTMIGGDCLVFSEESAQTLDINFGTTHFNNTIVSSDGTERTAGTWKVRGKWILKQPALWDGTVQWGGKVQADKYDYRLDEPFLRLGAEEHDDFLLSASTHVAAEWRWDDRLTVQPSIGGQALFAWEGLSVDPRIRLSYQPGGAETVSFTAATGIYHQITTGITDERDAGSTFRIWQPSPFRNRPLQAYHALLGWDQRVLPGLRFSVEGWYKTFRDLAVPEWTPIVRFNTTLARADGRAYGTDLSLRYRQGSVRLGLNYGYGNVTYQASEERLGAWVGDPIVEYSPPHDVRHKVGVTSSLETDVLTANVRWQFTTGLPFTRIYAYDTWLEIRGLRSSPTQVVGIPRALYQQPYRGRLPPYHRFDASVQRTVSLSSSVDLSAKAGAMNAYDRRNVFYIDIFTLDRVDQLPVIPYVSLKFSIH